MHTFTNSSDKKTGLKKKKSTFLLHQHHGKMYADVTFISIPVMQMILIANSAKHCLLLSIERGTLLHG